MAADLSADWQERIANRVKLWGTGALIKTVAPRQANDPDWVAMFAKLFDLPDRQIPHARPAQTARRAVLPQIWLAASGKSRAPSRASRLAQEGRLANRHRT
jgi:hypothetical protein